MSYPPFSDIDSKLGIVLLFGWLLALFCWLVVIVIAVLCAVDSIRESKALRKELAASASMREKRNLL